VITSDYVKERINLKETVSAKFRTKPSCNNPPEEQACNMSRQGITLLISATLEVCDQTYELMLGAHRQPYYV
jgi:hypothetical protein